MPEAAHPEDGDDVRRTGSCALDCLVRRDARARERCGIDRVDAVGHLDDVATVRLHEPARPQSIE